MCVHLWAIIVADLDQSTWSTCAQRVSALLTPQIVVVESQGWHAQRTLDVHVDLVRRALHPRPRRIEADRLRQRAAARHPSALDLGRHGARDVHFGALRSRSLVRTALVHCRLVAYSPYRHQTTVDRYRRVHWAPIVMPRSAAMSIAPFSPTTRAVELVFEDTLPGQMERSQTLSWRVP